MAAFADRICSFNPKISLVAILAALPKSIAGCLASSKVRANLSVAWAAVFPCFVSSLKASPISFCSDTTRYNSRTVYPS